MYRRPDWFTTNVFNRAGALLAKLGIDIGGTHVLTVPGRRTGELRKGRRRRQFTATEIPTDERPPIIRDYVKRWRSMRSFFEVGPDDPDERFRAIAPDHPVFRIAVED